MPAETGNLITTLRMIVNFSLFGLPNLAFFSQCIVVEWPKNYLPYLHEAPSHNTIILTYLDIDKTLQPISLFTIYTRHPHPPTPYVTRPGGRRPPGKRQTSIHV